MSPEAGTIADPDPTPRAPNQGADATPRPDAPYRAQGNTGFMRTVDKTRHGVDQIRDKTHAASSRAVEGVDGLDRWIREKLRFDKPEEPEQVPTFLPPKGLLYDWGDRLDATAGNAARRGWEIGYSAGGATRSAIGTLLPPAYFAITKALSPIRTITSPLETVVDAVKTVKKSATRATRAVTSTAKTFTNIFINGPTRFVDELVHRGIERSSQRKMDTWYYKPFKVIGATAGWIAEKPRKITEFITKPLYNADKWLAEHQ